MAKWTVKPGMNNTGSLVGTFEYDSGTTTGDSNVVIYQDEKPFLDQAKRERETHSKKDGYTKFATIPDIVAIEIMNKYGIDIHHPDTMRDREKLNRFKQIIISEYAYLVVNK